VPPVPGPRRPPEDKPRINEAASPFRLPPAALPMSWLTPSRGVPARNEFRGRRASDTGDLRDFLREPSKWRLQPAAAGAIMKLPQLASPKAKAGLNGGR
jgi:hypothetical protein